MGESSQRPREQRSGRGSHRAVRVLGGLGNLRPFAEVIEGSRSSAELRDDTYLASAGALYAIGYAVHLAHHEHKIPTNEAMRALSAIDFNRPAKDHDITPNDTAFAGNLVDPSSGRIAAGRAAWEAAGDAILDRMLKAIEPSA